MYAIIKTGGKQYRVVEGDVIEIELLDAEPGAHVEFKDVLFFHDGSASQIGAPILSNFIVKGEVIGSATGPKVTSVKYKPSHTQCRKFGHRQKYLKVKITTLGHHEKHGQHHEKHSKRGS